MSFTDWVSYLQKICLVEYLQMNFVNRLAVEYLQSTAQLINALKMEAEATSDAESRSKLLSAAKLLADATTKMVEVAKV